MFCGTCGKEIEENAVYCKFCGTKVNESDIDKLEYNLENFGFEAGGIFFRLGDLNSKEERGDYYFHTGVKKGQEGEYRLAIDYFKKALEYDPKAVNSYGNIALAYRKLEDYQNALLWIKKYLEHKPNDTNFLYNMSEIYSRMNQFNDALEVMEVLISLDPNNTHYQDIKKYLLSKL